jgi:hypothetical protein
MVVDPPTRLTTNGHSSSNMLTKNKSERKGERLRSLVRKVTSYGKNKPYRGVRKSNNCLGKQGGCAGFSIERINGENRETLCKTIIGFSPEFLAIRISNVATANETRNDDGCFIETPASAKQAGVLHQSKIPHADSVWDFVGL